MATRRKRIESVAEVEKQNSVVAETPCIISQFARNTLTFAFHFTPRLRAF